IGKVAGAVDHSREGTRRTAVVLGRLGVDSAVRDVVVLLVREHLTLAELATTRDVTDPAVAEELLTAVGHETTLLEALHLLTAADASAAGPVAWTPWRAALVARLVTAARERAAGRAAP